jgi:hypothetical protein
LGTTVFGKFIPENQPDFFESREVNIESASEMMVILHMLRNESPVMFDADTQDAAVFRTGSWEVNANQG